MYIPVNIKMYFVCFVSDSNEKNNSVIFTEMLINSLNIYKSDFSSFTGKCGHLFVESTIVIEVSLEGNLSEESMFSLSSPSLFLFLSCCTSADSTFCCDLVIERTT